MAMHMVGFAETAQDLLQVRQWLCVSPGTHLCAQAALINNIYINIGPLIINQWLLKSWQSWWFSKSRGYFHVVDGSLSPGAQLPHHGPHQQHLHHWSGHHDGAVGHFPG